MPRGRINFRLAAGSGPRGRLVLLGMLVLLGAGCDYWDNLTDPKAPSKGGLELVVRDAWTGNPLPDAACGDSAGKWTQPADGAGRIARGEMSTGMHTLACTCEHYFPRSYKASVTAAKGGADTVLLARKGGADWYGDEEARKVSFVVAEGTWRFPGKMRLQASPIDTTGIFRYEWTSSYHQDLSPHTKASLPLPMDALSQDTAVVTVTLRVRATLADTTYDVGSASGAIPLRRNQLPTISLLQAPPDSIKVGCRTNPPAYSFWMTTRDPDGKCMSVAITNTDTTSSLEKIDTVLSCSQGELVYFQLKDHASGAGIPIGRDNRLDIRVTDDNGQSRDTALEFKTYSTLPPDLRLEQEDIPDKNFPNTNLKFHILSVGGNSGFKKMFLDWNEGMPPDTFYLTYVPVLDRRFQHSYQKPGEYTINARVVDKCDDTSSVNLTLHVEANRLPRIGVMDPRGFQPGTNEYHLYVEASDDDVGAGLDSLSIQVIWGDGKGEPPFHAGKYQGIKRLFTHRYPADWAEPTFRIEVIVSDAHDGNVFDTATVVKPAAAFNQAALPPASTPPAPSTTASMPTRARPSAPKGLDRPGDGSQIP